MIRSLTCLLVLHFLHTTFGLTPWTLRSERCSLSTDQCFPIAHHLNQTCLGIQLPYTLTSSKPIVDDVARYDLELWTALRAIPACWDKLSFFLCSVYFPECTESPDGRIAVSSSLDARLNSVGNQSFLRQSSTTSAADAPRLTSAIILPEAEMCEAVHRACPLLVGNSMSSPVLMHPLPQFLDCSLYHRGCRQNSLTARLFQSTGGGCVAPLVTTNVRQNWLPGVERCGFRCRGPQYADEDYRLARIITAVSASVLLLVNTVVLITLRLQFLELRRKLHMKPLSSSTRKHSLERAVIPQVLHSWSMFHSPLFCLHLFFLISCVGWLMPLVPRLGASIACHADGTLRSREPQISQGNSFLCVFNFMVIYVCLTTAAVWSLLLDHLLVTRVQNLVRVLNIKTVPVLLHRWQRRRRKSSSANPFPGSTTKVTTGSQLQEDSTEPRCSLLPVSKCGDCEIPPHEQTSSLPGRGSQDSRETPFIYTHRRNPTDSAYTQPTDPQPLLYDLFEADFKVNLKSGDPSGHKSRTHRHSLDHETRSSHRSSRPSRSSSQRACLHLIALAPSLTLALICLTASEIDGDPLTGICIVGRVNVLARVFLLLVPSLVFVMVKVVYTLRLVASFHHLRRPFTNSAFTMDQEFAQRVRRSSYSYVGVLFVILICWILSISVDVYVMLREPIWTESQRLLFLCQLSYRLLGLNSQSARSTCLHHSPVTRDTTPSTKFAAVTLSSPTIGPIMLQLLICFILNGIAASACLCDRSVKQCWRAAFSRLCNRKQSSHHSSPCMLGESLHPQVPVFFSGFSWWDPGLFTPPILHELLIPQLFPTNQKSEQPTPVDPLHDHLTTSNEQLISQLERLIGLYQSSDPGNPALPLFLHMKDQLVASAHTTRRDVSAQVHDSVNQLMSRDESRDDQLFASVAALCDHLGKQLTASANNTTNVRRNRHRRLLSNKSSGRRRGHTRSLSINELSTATSAASTSGPCSTVSDTPCPVALPNPALSLLRAAASMISTGSVFGDSQHPVARHGSVPFPGSIADSVCGASQVSSSSIQSALTQLATSGMDPRARNRFSGAPSTSGRSLGSRMSLRSGASSSGAESYNSYRLLLNQSGAGWRELWRTRMLLMDVLRWAEAVAPTTQSNQELAHGAKQADWGRQVYDMVSSLVTHARQPPDNPPSFDPMMAAALAAATAAATVAMQQQQLNRSEGATEMPSCTQMSSPCGSTTTPNSPFAQTRFPPAYFHQSHMSPTTPVFMGQPDLLLNHDRVQLVHSSPPLLIHRHSSQTTTQRGPVEHRAAMFSATHPNLPQSPVIMPPIGFPPPMGMIPSAYQPVEPAGLHASDDSDAFNSDDEIMSDGEEDAQHVQTLAKEPEDVMRSRHSSEPEDGDVSSVSQSASQVVRQGSSSASSEEKLVDSDEHDLPIIGQRKRQHFV